MPSLSPQQAANIADAVYRVGTAADIVQQRANDKSFGSDNHFQLSDDFLLSGSTGPWLFKSRTGFGLFGRGVKDYQGHILLAFRGTATWRDYFTDANFGVQKGPSGQQLHAGFNTTFNSLVPELRKLLRGVNPSLVHCIGHSLGGALANVAMDWCNANGIGKTFLYTFGSPRVGLFNFATSLTYKVEPTSIYRVYHTADPISMVPIFPFFHLPQPGNACPITWPSGRISINAHARLAYAAAVKTESWATLRQAAEPNITNLEIEHWLSSNDAASAHTFSGKTLHYINLALAYIFAASKQTVGFSWNASWGAASLIATSGLTLLDRLAWFLTEASKMSAALSSKVCALLQKMLRFLGYQYVKNTQTTIQFVRWVLNLLMSSIYRVAQLALDAAHILSN